MIDFLVPADLGTVVSFFLIGFAAFTSFITAAAGIGGGVLLIAVMASLVPPAILIPLHGVVQIGSNAGRAILMWRHTNWAVVLPFIGGSLIGATIGGLTVVQLPPAILNLGLGLFILWSAWTKGVALPSRFASVATGVFSSFLTMFFGATGPFVAAMIKRLNLGRMEHVASHAMAMVAQHGIKVVAFGLLGFSFGPYVGLLVAMVASGFVGTVIGKRVLMKVNDKLFHRITAIVLTVLALRLLYQGVMALVA
ncbi:MAG: sulfite exporter TauE/SafE family protein [Alphaproteobacteria bacterium]